MEAAHGGRRLTKALIVGILGVQLAAVLLWFLSVGESVANVVAMAPLLTAGHVALGGILWFIMAGDDHGG